MSTRDPGHELSSVHRILHCIPNIIIIHDGLYIAHKQNDTIQHHIDGLCAQLQMVF